MTTEANFTENVIFLGLDENLANLTPEGYTTGVDQLAINLSSSSPTGIVRGFQTLRQLLPEGIEKGVT